MSELDPIIEDAKELEHEAPPAKRWLRWIGFALALVLLGASIYFAVEEGRSGGGFGKLLEADPLDLAMLLTLVLITTTVVNGLMFWVVNRPFVDPARPVHPVAMMGLLAASALLNYTPVKAGLVGRIAYLKHRHGVAYGASVLMHMMISGAMLGSIGVVLLATLWRRELDALWWVSVAVMVVAVALVGALLLHYVPPKKVADWVGRSSLNGVGHAFHVLLFGTALATVNLMGMAVRWWLVGRILQVDLSIVDATYLSLISTLSSAMPANGLGLREWLNKIGGEAGLLGKGLEASAMTVSLLDRAAEVAVVMVTGLVSLAWLSRAKQKLPTENQNAP